MKWIEEIEEIEEESARGSLAALRPRQNAIPFSPLSSPFKAQAEEVVTADHIIIILYPLEQKYT